MCTSDNQRRICVPLRDVKFYFKRIVSQMHLVFFLLSRTAFSARDKDSLVLYHTCKDTEYYDWFDYQCKACVTGLTVIDERCQCPLGQFFVNTSNALCTNACDLTTTVVANNHCVPISESNTIDAIIGTTPTIYFYDAATTDGRTSARSISMTTNFKNLLANASKACAVDPLDQTSCQFLANACAISQHEESSIACRLLETVLPSTGYVDGFYRDWPSSGIFMRYSQPYEHMMTEQTITSGFNYTSIVQFYIARYSYTGEFKGFFPLDDQLHHCGVKSDLKYIWKEFGKNYFSNCDVNLTEIFETGTTDFFEFFFGDNRTTNNRILRPIPILPVNYRQSGVANNAGSDPSSYTFFRRMFLYETSSNDEIYQYAQRITLHLEVRPENKEKIYLPYVIVQYKQGLKSEVSTREEANNFDVEYTMDSGNFWTLFLGLGIVIFILAVAYVLFNSCLVIRNNVSDGRNTYVIVAIVSFVFEALGTAAFVLVFVFSFYILCFFKWSKNIVFWLAPGGDYTLLYAFIWLAFALKVIGIASSLVRQTNTDIVVVDWQEVSEEERNSAFKRRITIANEWYKLTTLRGYDFKFILFFVLFVVEGLRCEILSSPIPSSELIWTGKSIKIIRFAFTSFIWMLITLVFWIFKRFVYWMFISNPFRMFEELCVALNISVVMKRSNTCGFYIHGQNMTRLDGITLNLDDSDSESDPEARTPESKPLPSTRSMKGGLSFREHMLEQARKKKKREEKQRMKLAKLTSDESCETRNHKKRKTKDKKVPDLTNELLDEKERRWTEYALESPEPIISDADKENSDQPTKEKVDEDVPNSEASPREADPDPNEENSAKDDIAPEASSSSHEKEVDEQEQFREEEELKVADPEDEDIEIETDSWSDGKELELSEYSSHSSVVVVAPAPAQDLDQIPVVQPLSREHTTNIFEVFIDPEFFYQTQRYSDAIERQLLPRKGQVFDADAPSVEELNDSLNGLWKRMLVDSKCIFHKLILPMSIGHKLFGIPPPVGEESLFVVQTSGSYKDSMLYGIEGSLMVFYLLLFSCLEMVTNSPAIGGLIVYIVDAIVVKVFKIRSKHALKTKGLCSHKSIIR